MHPGGRNGQSPAPSRRRRFKPDIDLLIEALQLASRGSRPRRGRKLAVGLLEGMALAIAPGSSRNQADSQDLKTSSASNSTDAPPRRAGEDVAV